MEQTPRHPQRPFGVTVIAIVQALNAIAVSVLVLVTGAALQSRFSYGIVIEFSSPVFGLLGLVIPFGLWRLRRWAWVATMVWTGANMALHLYQYWHGDPEYFSMALSVITVFYLNMRDVQVAFLGRTVHEQPRLIQ